MLLIPFTPKQIQTVQPTNQN